MSNRRRIRPAPPRYVVEFARAYRCSDCVAEVGRPIRDRAGSWHVQVAHDDTCPALTGAVDRTAAGMAAATAAALATSAPVVYVGWPR